MNKYQCEFSRVSGILRSVSAVGLGALKVRIERVVEKAGAGHDVGIVAADVGEPLAYRPEAEGLGVGTGLLGKVGAVDDPRQAS